MSDENDKENLVLKTLEVIQASIAKLSDRFDEMHVRFDGLQELVKETDLRVITLDMRLRDFGEVGRKTLSEVVSLSSRLKAVEKRLEVIEAPKH